MELGDRVRAARSARGWSQDRLARETGLSKQTIQNIEGGARARSDTMEAFTRAFRGWEWLTVEPVVIPDSNDELESGGMPPYLRGSDTSPSADGQLALV
jgi:transcriptional regulator with XRE-family HTH domain